MTEQIGGTLVIRGQEMKIRRVRARRSIATRFTCSASDIPQAFEAAYGKVFAAIKEKRIRPIGPPFALYLNSDMDALKIEAGMPVVKSTGATEEVISSVIPGGLCASAIHRGPYDELSRTYDALGAFLSQRGYESTGVSWEYYVNDPAKTKPERLKTRVFFQIRE